LLVLSSLLAQRAEAEDRVLLLDRSAAEISPRLRRQVVEAITLSLQNDPRWRVVHAASPEEQLRRRVAQLLVDAKKSSEAFEEARALEALARAERECLAAFGPVVEVEPLLQVLLARAKVYNETGQAREARADLSRVLALDPSRSLDPGVFPPSLIRAFGELKVSLSEERPAELRLQTRPPRQAVWVDGRQLAAPLTTDLLAGEHLLTAGGVGRRVTLKANSTVELTLVAASEPDAVSRRLARRARAAWIVGVWLDRVGARYRVRAVAQPAGQAGGGVITSPRVVESQLPWATSTLGVKLAALLMPSTSPAPVVPTRRRSWVRSWWFWTTVTAVVGGGVAAAVLLTRDRDPRVHLTLTR
jgi:hypothetical protein